MKEPSHKTNGALSSFALLLGFLLAGEVIALGLKRLQFPVPGNVIGMVLLTLALAAGIVKLRHVEKAADLLLSELGLFFVAPGVGVMLHFKLIGREALPITAGLFGGTIAVLLVTGFVAKALERKHE